MKIRYIKTTETKHGLANALGAKYFVDSEEGRDATADHEWEARQFILDNNPDFNEDYSDKLDVVAQELQDRYHIAASMADWSEPGSLTRGYWVGVQHACRGMAENLELKIDQTNFVTLDDPMFSQSFGHTKELEEGLQAVANDTNPF